MKEYGENDTREFLVREVLMHGSDTLPPATGKRLAEIRRDKPFGARHLRGLGLSSPHCRKRPGAPRQRNTT
ncbi:MAG: hypothetical protein U5L72_09900 [Bacteroidales bacterium]|nr:hypothetical protein [Bacteroidales bacterium]